MARGQLSEDVKHFSYGYPLRANLGQLAHSGKIPGKNHMFLGFGPPCGPEGHATKWLTLFTTNHSPIGLFANFQAVGKVVVGTKPRMDSDL
jgi:hypothetical protein